MTTTSIPKRAKHPVSRHPAFPAVVALWFAALLGFGMLVMPIIVLERAIEAIGLASVLPAASPPLGRTALLLAAAAAGVVGGLLGLAIARRVAAAHGAALSTSRGPLNAHEDLAHADDDFSLLAVPVDRVTEPLALALDDELPSEPLGELRGAAEFIDLDHPALAGLPAEDLDVPLEQFPTFAELERRRNQRRSPEHGAAPGSLDRRLFLRRTEDEPLAFAVPPLARRVPDNENTPAPAGQDGAGAPSQYFTPADVLAAAALMPSWQSEPLEQLGLVQLVERLGASLAKHRTLTRNVAPPAVAAAFDAAPADEAAQAVAAYFARQESTPDQPDIDDAEEHIAPEGDFGSLLSLKHPAPPAAMPNEALRKALATLQRMSGTA